jgi:hypothetical protein
MISLLNLLAKNTSQTKTVTSYLDDKLFGVCSKADFMSPVPSCPDPIAGHDRDSKRRRISEIREQIIWSEKKIP